MVITPDDKVGISGGHGSQGSISKGATLSRGNDTTLWVWSFRNGKYLRILKGHTANIEVICFTPDGKKIISSSEDATLRIWDIRSGDCLKILKGHTCQIWGASITPDGKSIISGGLQDKTLRVWDIESGECIAIYQIRTGLTSISEITSIGHFAYGTLEGEVNILRLCNFPIKFPIVTPTRIWLYGKDGNHGVWEENITAICQWCGGRFPVSEEIFEAIKDKKLSPIQSPCLDLPEEAWDDQKLLSECPLCHLPLKFNPFIVDNKGRVPTKSGEEKTLQLSPSGKRICPRCKLESEKDASFCKWCKLPFKA